MKYTKEWLTREEYKKLVNYPYIKRRDELIIKLLYSCALRVSELINIQVRDIDFENSNLVIWESKKSQDPALIPIPPHLVKHIYQWTHQNKLKKYSYLIPSRKGKKLSRTQIYRLTRRLAKTVGIEKNISTHTFRRSRATHLLDAGLALEKVSQLLRHKHLESTMTYLKISIKALKNDLDTLDNELEY
jgi:integrase/recombinase XerD